MNLELIITRMRDNRNPFPGRITGIRKVPLGWRTRRAFENQMSEHFRNREIARMLHDAEELEQLADLVQEGVRND